jgi:hypothetical protein
VHARLAAFRRVRFNSLSRDDPRKKEVYNKAAELWLANPNMPMLSVGRRVAEGMGIIVDDSDGACLNQAI